MLHSGGLTKTSSSCSLLQNPKGEISDNALRNDRKDNTKAQTGDTYTMILALHQMINNVI